jgi:signal recognition particle receptor subunit beta
MPGDATVNARILYWGVAGAGKTANLQHIHDKLRPDHRGDLQHVASPEDPGVSYELMPIELGKISGVRTRLQIVAPPGAPDHAATRQQLLDEVDGIVFVLDARRDRVSENLAALEELRSQLERYGRSLDRVPVVLQYNHRDETDDLAVEELHRKIGLRCAAFEAIATRGIGVLESLTTISKRVVRNRREASGLSQPPGGTSVPPSGATSVPPTPSPLTEPPAGGTLDLGASARGDATQPEEHTLPEEEKGAPRDSIAQAVDVAARRAERIFDEHWDQATGGLEARTSAPADLELRIVAAGDPVVEDGRRLRLTLRLVDQDGRQGDCVLTLDLSALRSG